MPEPRAALTPVYFTGRFGRLDRGGPGLTLVERASLKMTEVAAWGDTGADLPAPNRSMEIGDGVALWLGPDRWLLVGCAAKVKNAAVVDQSQGRVAIRLQGAAVRDLLAKGCPLDLDRFDEGDCAGTRLGTMAVLLHAVAADTIDVYVARSIAASCWEWLTDAAGEFGYEVLPI